MKKSLIEYIPLAPTLAITSLLCFVASAWPKSPPKVRGTYLDTKPLVVADVVRLPNVRLEALGQELTRLLDTIPTDYHGAITVEWVPIENDPAGVFRITGWRSEPETVEHY